MGEAQCLSQLNQIEGIVSVKDFFYENNTAYIVMQNIEGISVKEYVKKNGRVPAEHVVEMFHPVLEALDKVHSMGIIHRDISPDNLMVKKDGGLVLIDFGAARMRNIDNTKTMTVMFKRGFSPEEQYQYKGKWGAYTDIYSLCATMYYMMTATVPMDSIMRAVSDDMLSLVSMREISLPLRQKKALMKGMEVAAEKRYQNIGQLCGELYGTDGETKSGKEHIGLQITRRKVMIASAALVLILILSGGKIWYDSVGRVKNETEIPVVTPVAVVPDATDHPYEMISLTNRTKEEAEQMLQNYGDSVHITWKKKYSSTVNKGYVISQSVAEGEQFTEAEPLELIIAVSNGVKKVKIPQLLGKTKAKAEKILAQQKLNVEFVSEANSNTKGTVIRQSIKAGTKVREGKKIVITISEGEVPVKPTASPKKRQTENDKKGDFAGVIK